MQQIVIIAGSSHPTLAQKICKHLNVVPCKYAGRTDPDNCITEVAIGGTLEGRDVYIVQSGCSLQSEGPVAYSVHDHFMEAKMLARASIRAGARRVTLVAPYPFYAHRDRDGSKKDHCSITLQLAIDELRVAGVSRIIAIDFHNRHAADLMSLPVISLPALPLLAWHIERHWKLNRPIAVASNFGEVEDIGAFARRLNLDTAIIDYRDKDKPKLIGNVNGRDCLIFDDSVRTGDTACASAVFVKTEGAARIFLVVSHGVLYAGTRSKLEQAPIERLLLTDTMPPPKEGRPKNTDVQSISRYLAAAIDRMAHGESTESLLDPANLQLILPGEPE